MSEDRNKRCEERIASAMQSREDWMAAHREIADAWGDGARPDPEYDNEWLTPEGAMTRIDELPLGISTYTMVRIELSTGGPGDWLEAQVDDEGYVLDVTYHYNDWFDHAERPVPQDSALWAYAESIAEYMVVK